MTPAEIAEAIGYAILNEEVVRFTYFRPDNSPMQRTVSFYEASEDGQTFLGYDHMRAALRRFDIGKIMDVETIDEDYVYPIEKED